MLNEKGFGYAQWIGLWLRSALERLRLHTIAWNLETLLCAGVLVADMTLLKFVGIVIIGVSVIQT